MNDNNNTAHLITMGIGWLLLIVSWIWPSKKWGGYAVKAAIAFAASGVFLANIIYRYF